ncbi:MAG: tetratricopeptide repeat protein, partial [Lewinellaceae bacterium]|nr:tetratricopeptide repeat protein [Lewinellaceae bacterium]
MPRTLLKILLLLLTLYLALVWAKVFPHPVWLSSEIEPLTVISGILLAIVQWREELLEKARDLAPHPAPKYLATPPSELTSGVIPRPYELRDLRRQLRHSTKPVVICGIGGLGKTTFAQLYCQRFGGSYWQVVWLSASAVFSGASTRESDNAEYFLRAFIEDRTLLSKLNVVFDDRDTAKERFDKVIARLADEEGPMLLVVDNAPEAAARFTTELSRLKNWRILLTSRDEIHNMDCYRLDVLPPQRAAQLFCNIYGERSTDPAIDTVIRAYGYHTLTIELLAAYAREKNIQPFELRGELEERGLLQLDALHLGLPNAPKMQSLSEHLLQTFLLELDENEQEIMRYMCLLPPSNTLLEPGLMSEDSLCKLFGKEADKVAFQNTLRNLARLHWLVKEDGEFRCHPVVAETAKAQLLPDAENCAVLIEKVTELLVPDMATNEPMINRARFAPLGEAVFGGLWKESGDFVEADELVASLALRLGSLYDALGEFAKALYFKMKMVAIREKVLSADHVDLATSYNNLAATYFYLGNFKKCKEY